MLLVILPLLALSYGVAALWPLPAKHRLGNSTLWMSDDVSIDIIGADNRSTFWYQQLRSSSSQPSAGDRIVATSHERMRDAIFKSSYVPWKFHPRNADFEPDHRSQGPKITMIKLQRTGIDPPGILKPSIGDVDESYSLQVTVNGEVTIAAATSIGLSRGQATLSQLFYKHSEGGAYTPFAPVDIQDNPMFPYRGFNLDLSRSFFEEKDIKRTIDALAMAKFNVLHLHMTDSQSWPLKITTMPELSQKGAYRKDLVYSPEAINGIQEYGALRGIQVYLEIDMPGHTAAIWYSHPELIANFNVQPWTSTAAEPPTGVLKLNETKVYDFVTKLFSDLLPRLSAYTTYFHTGGDELKYDAYLYDDTVQSNNPAVLKPLVQALVDHSHGLVRNAGLTPIVWEEMILSWNLTLGQDTIVQAWNEESAVARIVGKGYRAVGGLAKYWYLDCGYGQWMSYVNAAPNPGYPDWCSPLKNWKTIYSYDPLEGVPAASRDKVLGGEVHVWTEQIDGISLDSVVWPRAAAAAEVLWSGPNNISGNVRPQPDVAMRLSDLRERLVAMGIAAMPVQMPFCTMEKHQCDI